MSSIQELEELKKRLGIIQANNENKDNEPNKIDQTIKDGQNVDTVDTIDVKNKKVNNKNEDPFDLGIPLSELIPSAAKIRRKLLLENYIMSHVDFDQIVSGTAGTALYEGQEYTLNDLTGVITTEGEDFKATIDMVSPIITPKGKGLLVKISILVKNKKIDETIIGGKNQDEIKTQIKILLERAKIKFKQNNGGG